MILLVLVVMIGSLALLVFGLWWLSRVFPRVAAALRLSQPKLAAICAFLVIVSCSTYAGWRVECPFCHAGHVDANGRCALGTQCGNFYTHPDWAQMSAQERSVWTGDPGHYKARSCPWCWHTGKMSRIAIWLD